jgi:hypothetical protein
MTNFDPTTNRISWGLLTPEEQEALLAWPHGLEKRYDTSWGPLMDSYYVDKTVYRGKPAPKKITYYCNVYCDNVGASWATVKECKEGSMKDTLGILQIDIINDTPTFTFIPKE